jgi:hypothetical protein
MPGVRPGTLDISELVGSPKFVREKLRTQSLLGLRSAPPSQMLAAPNPTTMKRIACVFAIVFMAFSAIPSQQEDAAADAVATAFLQARQAAHLSTLERTGGNMFRQNVCRRDLRLPSGLISDVIYETSDPTALPQAASRLATRPDSGKVAARFGLGVCMQSADSLGRPKYSVLIATYESGWASFLRIFWD